jgi:hypothetical protein
VRKVRRCQPPVFQEDLTLDFPKFIQVSGFAASASLVSLLQAI